jgi:hypothetical protein
LYHFDEFTDTLTPTDSINAGSFLTSVAVHPNRQWIYANDSFANTVRQFTVTGDQIDLTATTGIPVFGTALKLSPDGRFLYASGGISAGGNAFVGYAVDETTGALTALPGSPFTSPGQSPKGFAITPDGAYLYVSHGTDATIRAFRLDLESGIPTDLGTGFDVGLQGTLQGMDTLRGRLFAADNSTAIDGLVGIYSFAINAITGGLTPATGPPPTPFVTQGISPNDVIAWPGPACDADLTGDGEVDFFDLLAFVSLYNDQNPAADLGLPKGVFNIFDITAYLGLFNDGCP